MLVLRTSTARRGSSRHKLPSASSTNEIGSAGADGAGGGSILSTGVGAGDSTRTSTGCVGVAARRAWERIVQRWEASYASCTHHAHRHRLPVCPPSMCHLPGRCCMIDRVGCVLAVSGWPTGWPTGWLADWLADWLAGRLAGWPTGWLADWLAGRPAGRLAGWLAPL